MEVGGSRPPDCWCQSFARCRPARRLKRRDGARPATVDRKMRQKCGGLARLEPLVRARSRWLPSGASFSCRDQTAMVTRLRSRCDSSASFHTSPNSTSSVSRRALPTIGSRSGGCSARVGCGDPSGSGSGAATAAFYCSSLTFSIHRTAVPSLCSVIPRPFISPRRARPRTPCSA